MTLKGAQILVVEDDTLIALDLKDTLLRAGATVIGPAHDLAAALRLAEDASLSAAVLDLRLLRGDTRPVAARLAERGIPSCSRPAIRGPCWTPAPMRWFCRSRFPPKRWSVPS